MRTYQLRKLQRDVLRRLKERGEAQKVYRGLRDCRPTQCGREKCSSVCRYADWRLCRSNLRSAMNLVQQTSRPLLQVNVTRASWARKVGKLHSLSLRAPEQLVRRALDSFYDPAIVAVGAIKPFAHPSRASDWLVEVQLIVAGAEKSELEAAFRAKPYRGALPQVICVLPVQDLRASLQKTLRSDPCVWEHPRFKQQTPERARQSLRAEYYAWIASLAPNARLIRYGCDRYFNKIKKRSRIRPPRLKKKRPNPRWLEPYQFGTNSRDRRSGL